MQNLLGHISQIRSLGFGAMIGAGIFGSVYILFPDIFSEKIVLGNVTALGALLGAGTHRLIDKLIVGTIFCPIGRFITYYSKIVQLVVLGDKLRLINKKQKKAIVEKLSKEYFLDSC